jgi:peptidoglycan hydrolase CwlO-like protein
MKQASEFMVRIQGIIITGLFGVCVFFLQNMVSGTNQLNKSVQELQIIVQRFQYDIDNIKSAENVNSEAIKEHAYKINELESKIKTP